MHKVHSGDHNRPKCGKNGQNFDQNINEQSLDIIIVQGYKNKTYIPICSPSCSLSTAPTATAPNKNINQAQTVSGRVDNSSGTTTQTQTEQRIIFWEK